MHRRKGSHDIKTLYTEHLVHVLFLVFQEIQILCVLAVREVDMAETRTVQQKAITIMCVE